MCLQKVRRRVLELTPKESKSLRAWRKVFAVASILSFVGFFIWTWQVSRSLINNERTRGQTNITEKRSRLAQVFNGSLETRIARTYCQKNCETIRCSSIPAEFDPGKVAADFIKSDFQVDCTNVESVKLIFEKSKFPSNKLRAHWLPTDFLIAELTLESCSLFEIQDNAFLHVIYEDTKKLSMIDNRIVSLSKAMFRPFSKLQELTIRSNIIKHAEFNLLESVASTIKVLELNSVIDNTDVLRNITGGSTLLKIQILSIRWNSIFNLDSELFTGVPEVKSLYVDDSKIKTVSVEAFVPIAGSISQLIMNGNNIASLPEGVFDFVHNKQFRMTIDNNPWHCDCKLKWMQEIIQNYPTIIESMPICQTPKANAFKPFNRANFCSGAEPETSTARSRNNKTTTDDNRDCDSTDESEACDITINLTCTVPHTYFQTRISRSLFSTTSFEVRSRFPNFSATESNNGSITVKLPYLNTDIALLWFDNGNVSESLNCAQNVKHSFVLPNVERSRTYTICLLDNNRNTVSPLNCLGISTSPNDEERTWLSNADKTAVLSFTSVSIILLILISAFVTFILIRRHPSLLRGSKRVMLVKRRNVDAIVLPKGVRIDDKEGEGRKNVSAFPRKLQEDGYVTPLPPAPLPTRSCRRMSRMSFQSDGNSYVSGIEPTAMQLASWRLRRLKSRFDKQRMDAPPLPPHPYEVVPSLSLTVDAKEDEQLEYSAFTV